MVAVAGLGIALQGTAAPPSKHAAAAEGANAADDWPAEGGARGALRIEVVVEEVNVEANTITARGGTRWVEAQLGHPKGTEERFVVSDVAAPRAGPWPLDKVVVRGKPNNAGWDKLAVLERGKGRGLMLANLRL
jgi:hypothetical protein